LGAVQALGEIAQVALKLCHSLLVGVISQVVLLAVLAVQQGNPGLQFGKALGCDVIGLGADLALHRLLGLGGLIFIDESAAHGFLLEGRRVDHGCRLFTWAVT